MILYFKPGPLLTLSVFDVTVFFIAVKNPPRAVGFFMLTRKLLPTRAARESQTLDGTVLAGQFKLEMPADNGV